LHAILALASSTVLGVTRSVPISTTAATIVVALATPVHRAVWLFEAMVLVKKGYRIEAIAFVIVALVKPHQDTVRD
jgi:hypothetical protein